MSKIKELWNCGRVTRYHTMPPVTPQNVADHSWGVSAIVCFLWPSSSANLLRAAILHDCGEATTGDISTMLKRARPDIADAFREMEDAAVEKMGVEIPELEDQEKHRLKVADLIDLVLFANFEVSRGNKTFEIVTERGKNYLAEYMTENFNREERKRIWSQIELS